MMYYLIGHGRLIDEQPYDPASERPFLRLAAFDFEDRETRLYRPDDLVDYYGGKATAADIALGCVYERVSRYDALRFAGYHDLASRLREASQRNHVAYHFVDRLTRQLSYGADDLLDWMATYPEPIDGVSREAYDAAVREKQEARAALDWLLREEIEPITYAAFRRLLVLEGIDDGQA